MHHGDKCSKVNKRKGEPKIGVGEKCIKEQIPKVIRGASQAQGDEKGITCMKRSASQNFSRTYIFEGVLEIN